MKLGGHDLRTLSVRIFGTIIFDSENFLRKNFEAGDFDYFSSGGNPSIKISKKCRGKKAIQ